jgi:hypothetical protein
MSTSEHRRNWQQIGAALLSIGALGLLAWYGSVRGFTSADLPLWPMIPLALLIIAGLYFLVAPIFGGPVPSDHEDRVQRRVATANARGNAEAQRLMNEQRAARQAELAVEARKWQVRLWGGHELSNRGTAIYLWRPAHLDPKDLAGTSARCQITQSENVFTADATFVYDPNRAEGFRVIFPADFEPRSPLAPGNYFVTWLSEVLDEPRKGEFKVTAWGWATHPDGRSI